MIPFVDAHVHFWDLKRISYPWLTPPFDEEGPNGSVEAIARTYLPEDYCADLADFDHADFNLVGAVHVDAGADAKAALDETIWLEGTGEACGIPSAIVAFAALNDDKVDHLLEAQAAHPRVRGIRHIVNWHPHPERTYSPRDVTLDPAWERGLSRLPEYHLSFDLQCYPGQMNALAQLLARHPDVPVAINHLGMPVLADQDGLAVWRMGMAAMAALPQVVMKVSGFGFIDRTWTLEGIEPLVHEVIDMFSPDRILFASDFPTDKLFAPPVRCLSALQAISASYSEHERAAMFGRNAARFYRIDVPELRA